MKSISRAFEDDILSIENILLKTYEIKFWLKSSVFALANRPTEFKLFLLLVALMKMTSSKNASPAMGNSASWFPDIK